MGDPLSTIKPAVRNLQAYTLKHFRAAVKVNQNENPFDMPEAVKRAVHQAVSRTAWSRYPDFVPASLISRLADFSHWKEDGVLVGNGSNELIEALMVVVVERGKRVVLPQPTFTLYGMFARILGGACRDVPLKPDLEFDGSGLLREARQADLTILCSPNNPTGGVLDRGDLEKILRQAAGLVVVDEAYHEFSRQSVVPLLERFENLVVLRTFSKAMSMAGLRVGYLLGRPELVEQVAKAKLPYNLNVFSMAAASAALEHFDLLKPQIERVIAERERLWEGLSRIPGVQPFPSRANFIVFRLAADPREVFKALCAEGILVRDVSRYPMLRQFLRVSVGLPEENDRFLAALRRIMQAREAAIPAEPIFEGGPTGLSETKEKRVIHEGPRRTTKGH